MDQWKEFKIGEIFELVPTKGIISDDLLPGKDIPYIAAKHDQNGLSMMCQRQDFENWISKGNCIVFIQLGAGSAGFVNYLEDDFIGMSGKTICGYIPGILNPYIGLFLETLLCLERPKYSFGRSRTGERLRKTIIKLPVNDLGNPDREFMENYIKSLHSKPITTKNKPGKNVFHTDEWKEFRIGDLFDVQLSKGDIKLDEVDKGNIPLISSGESNNGIVGYISEKGDGKASIFQGNTLTVDMFCNAFYQINSFYAVSHGRVNILSAKCRFNQYIGLFLVTLIRQEQLKYSYGRAVYSNETQNMIIKLPVNSEGNPDREYMENYIKNLPYGDRI